MKTLYWHDYEAWGTSPSQDRPSQFAGIRTDEHLNIISDPLVIYCRPTHDCLPHPEACLLTGITPQKALADGVSEINFFQQIHEQLTQPNTCGVGYNSIRFDDEMTRYGLYRNFYDPYEREWKNGNSRWDIIDMVRLTYALRPDSLRWPVNDDGIPNFKLENLSKVNGLLHEVAHDALSDVHATIGLAKLIKERQPELYNYVYGLRDKRRVSSLIDIQRRKPLLHISSRLSAAHGCAALMVPLQAHPTNNNSVICYDLSVDPEPLLTLSADDISARLFVKQQDLPEGCERIPLKEIHLNKSPIVATPKLLDEQAAERLGINKQQCDEHWQLLRYVDFQDKISRVYRQNQLPERTDSEQKLYDGFINNNDKNLFMAIRGAEPKTLSAYSEQLSDPRLKTLLFRYRARHYPATLSVEEMEQWQQWRYQRLTDENAGASIVLEDFFERLSVLSKEIDVDQSIVQGLLSYGDQLLE
ncbi:exodeoxyribonuclease I [Candidatus Endobugula sertula]|uniref:Exodeoxyribonuclease I n=1 Tax=Candidatus Endobugula sertula TaxID=62101 RepID=A0A1D2QPH2_9GAMM|nr:exodeoxyribonuclease I [Candidatus Endobugula sertula]